MYTTTQKQHVINLRAKGYSYSYIASKTGIAKSTLSEWLALIPYIPNVETIRTIGKARAASGARKSEMKRESLQEAKRQAEKEIGTMSRRDAMMFGLGLYLGEGAKTGDIVRVVNSDPRVMQLAVLWFSSLGVRKEQFAARLHLYPDSNLKKSLQFWSRTTTIPVTQFHKPHIDSRTDKKLKKKGKLPFGTLHLTVRAGGRKEYGSFFFRKIQAWNEEVLRRIQKSGHGLPV